jgi:K(+)-stimulated pyrophosphate-energized sodium pump
MIKVINLVSLLAAPILIHYPATDPGVIIAIVICAVLIFGAILYSKHGTLSFKKPKTIASF